MVQILHQRELVLLLTLAVAKDQYVIFKINKQAYSNFTHMFAI